MGGDGAGEGYAWAVVYGCLDVDATGGSGISKRSGSGMGRATGAAGVAGVPVDVDAAVEAFVASSSCDGFTSARAIRSCDSG